MRWYKISTRVSGTHNQVPGQSNYVSFAPRIRSHDVPDTAILNSKKFQICLLVLALFVLVERSASNPYKLRFYKYDVQEDCEYDEDYPRPEPKSEIKPDPQYENQEEDCEEDKGSVSSTEGDYPQQELEYGSPEVPKPTRKYDMEIPPPSINNVIPQSSNLPVYPQWGAHEPNPEKDFHGTRKTNQDGGSSEYPGITNVQGVDAQPPRSPYPGFSRRCDSYFDCDFATPYSNSSHEMDASTWFSCDGRFCICELLGVARDDIPLRVTWSKEMKKCLSDEGGPCGRHNGLTIYCDMQFVCRENYCEKPGRVKPSKPSCDSGDCDDDQHTSLFSILFFPSNTFHNILNNSLTGITEENS
ncbi:unnamed protein product [Allacma fusca]|uniref:Uncharacterized protein n=1 Tax=Allacma fusca TaxID=39272 RepID=A0A8J2MH65_9HEXA|nr:unnamed protein product [Allacma fusca]